MLGLPRKLYAWGLYEAKTSAGKNIFHGNRIEHLQQKKEMSRLIAIFG